MNFSRITKLTEEEKRLKDELRVMGQDFQSRAQVSQEKFEPTIAKFYDETPAAPIAARVPGAPRLPAVFGWLRRPFVFAPTALVLLILAVGAFQQYQTQSFPAPLPMDMARRAPLGSESSAAPQAPAEAAYQGDDVVEDDVVRLESSGAISAEMSSAEMFAPSPTRFRKTLKERFLERLGQHEASPDDVASRPQVFEQDVHAELMTTKSQDEVVSAMRSTFESLGGFIESINTYHVARSRDSVTIRGKVPVRSLEVFRTMLSNFAQEDKYYRERIEAYNRTADVVVIENERKKVEESIAYLEGALLHETDPQKRAELEAQLETHRARLREREATREVIQDRVEYADVSIAAILLPTFWKGNSLKDFRQLYVGFGESTLFDQFKINATAIVLFILHALSYFFWVIPIAWWLWRRKSRRAKALLKELE